MVITHDAGRRQRQSGVTFLTLLLALAIAGVALAGAGVVWQMESRRENEKELLFRGEAYRRAIDSYYEQTPGEPKQYPQRLDELLQDQRYPMPVRHLRRLYREPMAPDGEWQLIVQRGRIVGVASKSRATPIKIAGFAAAQQHFEGAGSYAEWRFVSAGAAPHPDGQPLSIHDAADQADHRPANSRRQRSAIPKTHLSTIAE